MWIKSAGDLELRLAMRTRYGEGQGLILASFLVSGTVAEELCCGAPLDARPGFVLLLWHSCIFKNLDTFLISQFLIAGF